MPCLADLLTVAGGLAEIGGLVLVIAEIIKVQRREFPQHRGAVKRGLSWLRRLGPKRAPQTFKIHPAHEVDTAGSISKEVMRGPAPTLEGRVERVEKQMEDLQRKQREDKAEIEQRILETARRAHKAASGLRALIEQRDEERREGLADALLLQKIGVAAFIFGVGLSVWGNLAPC